MEILLLITSLVIVVATYGILLVLEKLRRENSRLVDKLFQENRELNDRLMHLAGRPYLPTFHNALAAEEPGEEGEKEEELNEWHSVG